MSDIEYKAFAGKTTIDPQGSVSALVATWQTDKHQDRLVRGAFAKSLAQWRASGDPIPMLFNHQAEDPEFFIGEIEPADAEETSQGLVIRGKLDLDSAKGRQTFQQLQRRRLTQWSYGFIVQDAPRIAGGVRELRRVHLVEVSPVLVGAGAGTQTLSLKTDLKTDPHAEARATIELAQRRADFALAVARYR